MKLFICNFNIYDEVSLLLQRQSSNQGKPTPEACGQMVVTRRSSEHIFQITRYTTVSSRQRVGVSFPAAGHNGVTACSPPCHQIKGEGEHMGTLAHRIAHNMQHDSSV